MGKSNINSAEIQPVTGISRATDRDGVSRDQQERPGKTSRNLIPQNILSRPGKKQPQICATPLAARRGTR
jgi:hypothetical protein